MSNASPLALMGGHRIRTAPLPDWPIRSSSAREALLRVFDTGHWWQSGGGASESLEEALAQKFNVTRAVCVANGTVALELAIAGCGIGPGDEVIVPALTFVATASAVARCGATPVPADVSKDTLNIDTGDLENRLTSNTKALIIVHLAGQPADLTGARAFCNTHGLVLIEDSAQAISAEWDNNHVGSAGDLSILSFQSGKLLSGGEGGAILIRSPDICGAMLERMANCGRARGDSSYQHLELGTNARISEFSAALILSQFADIESLAVRRQVIFSQIELALENEVVRDAPEVTRNDHYMLLLRVPVEAQASGLDNLGYSMALTSEGIPGQVIYPPWHKLPAFGDQKYSARSAEKAASKVVWIHHRALLDKDIPRQLTEARDKILSNLEELVIWQERQQHQGRVKNLSDNKGSSC